MKYTAKDCTDLVRDVSDMANEQGCQQYAVDALTEFFQMILSGPPGRETIFNAFEVLQYNFCNKPEEPEVSEDDFIGEVKQTFGCPTCGED